MFNLKPSMLEALNKYNGALPQTLAPNLFMLILTIFNQETAPLWTGRTCISPLHILMTGSLTSPKNIQFQNTSPTSPP